MKESDFVPPLLEDESKAPGAFVSMLPILTPVVLLLLNTVWSLISPDAVPSVVAFGQQDHVHADGRVRGDDHRQEPA